MKNLKSPEEHRTFRGRIKNENARVITYGMLDSTYRLHMKSFLPGSSIIANFDSDPEKWGKELETGVITLPIRDLIASYEKADGLVVVSSRLAEIGEYLDSLGLSYYYGRMMDDVVMNDEGKLPVEYSRQALRNKKVIEDNRQKIEQVKKLLSDPISVRCYDSLLDARASDNKIERFALVSPVNTGHQYFPEDIPGFSIFKDGIFIDGGAYDGDTIAQYIQACGGKYAQIYAFEPDPGNFKKLRQFAGRHQNIICFEKGLFSREAVVEFSGQRNQGGFLLESGKTAVLSPNKENTVTTCALDAILQGEMSRIAAASEIFIKMDIEGSELEALKGSADTIAARKPKL
ncbi:MAG: FkbM family methyltransferase, partial [Synergistaceae bacterium]|nr:FkbM family methyltransferase [Synergistaceae bacterium]